VSWANCWRWHEEAQIQDFALQNTSSGVDKWSTWRLRTWVREAATGDRVELVLGGAADGEMNASNLPRPDHKYE
jgi:hypothetical protein